MSAARVREPCGHGLQTRRWGSLAAATERDDDMVTTMFTWGCQAVRDLGTPDRSADRSQNSSEKSALSQRSGRTVNKTSSTPSMLRTNARPPSSPR